jgi:hypothetical protein
MHIHDPMDDEGIQALERLQNAMRAAFCGVMKSTRLPLFAALNLAAMAVGSLYLEVSATHCDANPCPCGWEPSGAADVEALQSSLAVSASQRGLGLVARPIAGHA